MTCFNKCLGLKKEDEISKTGEATTPSPSMSTEQILPEGQAHFYEAIYNDKKYLEILLDLIFVYFYYNRKVSYNYLIVENVFIN